MPNQGMGESLLMENQLLPTSQPEKLTRSIRMGIHRVVREELMGPAFSVSAFFVLRGQTMTARERIERLYRRTACKQGDEQQAQPGENVLTFHIRLLRLEMLCYERFTTIRGHVFKGEFIISDGPGAFENRAPSVEGAIRPCAWILSRNGDWGVKNKNEVGWVCRALFVMWLAVNHGTLAAHDWICTWNEV